MTFSVVARDRNSGDLGVATQSKFLAAAATVIHAAADGGAIATQALANGAFGPDGLRMLRDGTTADAALAELLANDERPERRQLAIVDTAGQVALHTGAGCGAWAGASQGSGFGCVGNMLAGPEVVAAMSQSMLASTDEPRLARRLVAALQAGADAGGDARGQQSAGVLVVRPGGGYGGHTDRLVDLRVDDHPEPIAQLERLLGLHELYFERPDPSALLPMTAERAAEVSACLGGRGFAPTGTSPERIYQALERWAGRENLEERMVGPDSIDPIVLRALRADPT